MAANKQPVESLFKELDTLIQAENYNKIPKHCEKIFAVSPGDPEAFKCKVIAHIHLGEFDKAISTIDAPSVDKKLATELVFEKAYCLYRTRKLEEAIDAIKAAPRPLPPKLMGLEAQVRYRLEQYKQSATIYEDLMNQHKVDSSELKTNLCAAYTEAGMFKENQFFVEKNKSELQDTLEFAFNAVCASIATGDYAAAAEKLTHSKAVFAKSLAQEGELGEAEIQQELAVFQVQLAYCKQRMGKSDEAAALYNEALKTKPSDAVAAAVAINNQIATQNHHDGAAAMKKIKDATPDSVEQKLDSSQKKVLSFNKALLLMQTGKADQVREALQKSGIDEEGMVMINASLLVKEKKLEDAEKLLKEYSTKNPRSLQAPLCLAQIYLSKNALAQVISVLESLSEEYKYKPGVIAAIVDLYEKLSDDEGAIRTLDKYVEWAEKQKDKIDGDILARIMRSNGEYKLKHKKYEQAYEMFEKVLKKNRNDMLALPQAIIAASHFNPSLAEKYARIPTTDIDLDVDELERKSATARPIKQSAAAVTTTTPAAGASTDVKEKEKKKKKRKTKLPKNVVPGTVPDPERWLPKWQRSTFRKKQKKGQAQLGKGGQGVTVGAEKLLAQALPPSASGKPAAGAAKPAAQSSPVPSQAKKKKKSRK